MLECLRDIITHLSLSVFKLILDEICDVKNIVTRYSKTSFCTWLSKLKQEVTYLQWWESWFTMPHSSWRREATKKETSIAPCDWWTLKHDTVSSNAPLRSDWRMKSRRCCSPEYTRHTLSHCSTSCDQHRHSMPRLCHCMGQSLRMRFGRDSWGCQREALVTLWTQLHLG